MTQPHNKGAEDAASGSGISSEIPRKSLLIQAEVTETDYFTPRNYRAFVTLTPPLRPCARTFT